jgi:hypothetical protein
LFFFHTIFTSSGVESNSLALIAAHLSASKACLTDPTSPVTDTFALGSLSILYE